MEYLNSSVGLLANVSKGVASFVSKPFLLCIFHFGRRLLENRPRVQANVNTKQSKNANLPAHRSNIERAYDPPDALHIRL